MKGKCDCYHTQRKLIYGYYLLDVGICWGTKEMEECNCGGNRAKCDFYPEVREGAKKKITTNADNVKKEYEKVY